MPKLKNVAHLDLSDVPNPFANIDKPVNYDNSRVTIPSDVDIPSERRLGVKLDILAAEQYRKDCKAGNWGAAFDYENNEL